MFNIKNYPHLKKASQVYKELYSRQIDEKVKFDKIKQHKECYICKFNPEHSEKPFKESYDSCLVCEKFSQTKQHFLNYIGAIENLENFMYNEYSRMIHDFLKQNDIEIYDKIGKNKKKWNEIFSEEFDLLSHGYKKVLIGLLENKNSRFIIE